MRRLTVIFVAVLFIGLSCSVDAKDKKKTRRIDKPEAVNIPEIERVKTELRNEAIEKADNIIATQVELLNWKKQYYLEKATVIQQHYMMQYLKDEKYQKVMALAKEIDKELKRLMILQ